MKVEIPYLVIEVNGKLFMIDAYFSKKVEKTEHVSVLIKRFKRDLPREAQNPLPSLITENEIKFFLKNVFGTLYECSGKKVDERLRHMRKWNIHRFLGIPSGFKRHKEKEEELAKQNREILLALALLQEVLGIKSPKEFEEINIKPVGWRYYTIKVREDGIYNEKGEKDAIYTELLKIDKGFMHSIHALEYNQQATW
ncbi:hypothetical protein DRN38_01910 [Thermococci archaeon]|nr:MAG: hypothetical protein DRN38_01910 [Thermococci archaeon]